MYASSVSSQHNLGLVPLLLTFLEEKPLLLREGFMQDLAHPECQRNLAINALMDLAIKEGDHLSKNALEWFVGEQREEVSSMDTLLRMVRRAGEPGLFFVENYILQGGLSGPEGGEGEGEKE